ncbi:regulator of G-protein signaling 8-like isoform X2 [Anneissia japonica]|uniref:regulator of G-protein signaling 8-like isoform X2 n=1 Tax=Anneissia japonica TaxID=1529436 RepID=UPI0014258F8E|nr:regulator of G-protein signaling 8-like isoform X2 [Anneissia japonica]
MREALHIHGNILVMLQRPTISSPTAKPAKSPASWNFAKDLKDKVRSLRRRHTDSALRDAEKLKPPLPPCTLSEVRQWSESFDRLLRDKCGLEAFRRFLQTEFSDENIEFWLACEEYRTLSPSKHTNRARKIHEDYVATQAPREVNLDSATRIETTSNVRKPDEHTFDNAQKRIEALMEKDSYPRFLKSDIYQQLLRTSKKSEC